MSERVAERGAGTIEFVGLLPLLLIAALFTWQILLAAFTVTAAENAARTGSRVEGRGGDGGEAAIEALPSWLRDDADADVQGERVEVVVEVPIVFPGLSSDDLTVSRDAELPET